MANAESWVRLAPLLGLPARHSTGNPQDYCVAGQHMARLRDPASIVTVYCNAYAAHLGYTNSDVLPREFGGNGRNVPVAMQLLYADGHAKSQIKGIRDFLIAVLEPLN
ncbi:MAG: hypothetical protein OHK0029_05860 [Armatimonadaceae bacterium]